MTPAGIGTHDDAWSFALVQNGRLVGGAAAYDVDVCPAIGYWLLPEARGRGLATAAVELLVERLANAGVPRVELTCGPDNAKSIAVAREAASSSSASTSRRLLGRAGAGTRSILEMTVAHWVAIELTVHDNELPVTDPSSAMQHVRGTIQHVEETHACLRWEANGRRLIAFFRTLNPTALIAQIHGALPDHGLARAQAILWTADPRTTDPVEVVQLAEPQGRRPGCAPAQDDMLHYFQNFGGAQMDCRN